MFAVVTKVELPEDGTIEEGRKDLNERVIPLVKQAPGFVSAVFLSPSSGREGLSVLVFETKEQCQGAIDMQELPPRLKLISNDIREVAAKT